MKRIICCMFSFAIILTSIQIAQASLPKNIVDAFPSKKIEESAIVLKAPDIAENGAVVNIVVQQLKFTRAGVHVKELWLFDHFRKTPLAHYKLQPNALAKGLTSRYKLGGTSVIYAIALLSDGSMISGSKTIKVTIGGCGNGGSTTTGQHYIMPTNYPYSPYSQSSEVRLSSIPAPTQNWHNTESYQSSDHSRVLSVNEHPVSTFSVDVDTGSYSNIRRFIVKQGQLPRTEAVRVEEMVNYFRYQYPSPKSTDTPFSVTTEVGPTPWNKSTHLLHIGIQGYREDRQQLPPANLVFLVDVSGSMQSPDKLGLLIASLRMLTKQLDKRDKIALVAYAGASGVVLDTTPGHDTTQILNALDQLQAGGSTNGSAGIQLAYSMAQKSFIADGINRVILATDGDFNVGTIDQKSLIELIKSKRASGITLTTLGFGSGNYNELLMEQLADHGNGNYAYIDTLREARKVLVTELASTLFTIAKDVKVQVEFNPNYVAEYRLVGYENRRLNQEDFRNDKVDAGDIGAGHSVTALYEIAMVNSNGRRLAPLRYSMKAKRNNFSSEVAFVRIRYKQPSRDTSIELNHAVQTHDIQDKISLLSDNYRFASAVAAFGQILRNDHYVQSMDLDQVSKLAGQSLGGDENGYRKEFLDMVQLTKTLQQTLSSK